MKTLGVEEVEKDVYYTTIETTKREYWRYVAVCATMRNLPQRY